MKKLLYLLFIPFFFTCSSKDSSDDSSSDSIRDYLNSNVFVRKLISNTDTGDFPVEIFIQFNLVDGSGSTFCESILSENPSTVIGSLTDAWNEVILQTVSCESYIYQEVEDEIFIEMPICVSQTNVRYSISRSGNTITKLKLGNPYSDTYTITTFDYLQERKDIWNNNYSDSGNSTGGCYN